MCCSPTGTIHTPLAQPAFHQPHIHATVHQKTWHHCFSYSNTNFSLLPPYYKLYKFWRSTHTHSNFKDFCQSPVNRMAASMKQKKWMTRRWILSFPVVPNFFSARDWFNGRQFFHGQGGEGRFQDDSRALHLLCTLLFLHQLHLRSSDIRSQRLGTPILRDRM